MRYALYARYSSDNQSESSCEDQFRLCREAVAKDGGTIVREYSDHAISGASTLNRPEFQQMMLNAEAGNFDIIFAEDLSRLSRNFKDPAVLFEKLEYLGIKLITRTDGEITPLHIGLQGTMNALYLKDLADKTKRGQRGRVENGFIPGGLTYGYDTRPLRRLALKVASTGSSWQPMAISTSVWRASTQSKR